MLAAADRLPTLRRQLDCMPPYGLTVNALLARRRELLLAELELLESGSKYQTETEDHHGQ